jgi:hypothetical protein
MRQELALQGQRTVPVATLIDASVLIAAERGRLDLDAVVAQEADEVIALAAITASELLHGIHRAAKPAQRARREAFVEQVLATVAIIPFDLRGGARPRPAVGAAGHDGPPCARS